MKLLRAGYRVLPRRWRVEIEYVWFSRVAKHFCLECDKATIRRHPHNTCHVYPPVLDGVRWPFR